MDNEESIIEQAKVNPEVFGRLYDTYYQPIFGFLLGRTGNVEVAKDIASETFFQALKNIHKYKQRGKAFKSWLFAIAVAQVGNYYRKRAKMLPVTMDEAPEIVAEESFHADAAILEAEGNEQLQTQLEGLREAMKQLNQKQQNILTLRYFSQQTIPEIASTMKMKEGTVKSHIHRSLKKLHVVMTESQSASTYDRAESTQSRRAFGARGIS